MVLKEVFEGEFFSHYGITTPNVSITCAITSSPEFDLSDDETALGRILPLCDGDASFSGNDGNIQVLWYNEFINQCKKPRSFQEGRMRCDMILAASLSKGTEFLLLEITTEKEESNLTKPIKGGHPFAGGKNEKCQKQLLESLRTILPIKSISEYAKSCARRVCVMAYRIRESYMDLSGIKVSLPNKRFMKVEEKSVPSGAIYSNPDIEAFGFEFMRISHSQVFNF